MRLRLQRNVHEIRRDIHPTRPPRLEGKVKNAKLNPIRKPKKQSTITLTRPNKPQGFTDGQRKRYHLKGPHH